MFDDPNHDPFGGDPGGGDPDFFDNLAIAALLGGLARVTGHLRIDATNAPTYLIRDDRQLLDALLAWDGLILDDDPDSRDLFEDLRTDMSAGPALNAADTRVLSLLIVVAGVRGDDDPAATQRLASLTRDAVVFEGAAGDAERFLLDRLGVPHWPTGPTA